MRAVVQRVARARVTVDGEVTGAIGRGVLVLVGAALGDTPEDARVLAEKVATLRIFADAEGKMNLDVQQAGGGVLAVSQFTLLADCRKGRRPNFLRAAPPEEAERRYFGFCELLRAAGVARVETGSFGATMQVELLNDGPVTIWLDSGER